MSGKPRKYANWLASHKPFHWFVEFYGIMKSGGFDVVIGNPPYVVYTEKKAGYKVRGEQYRTFDTKNLYAYVFERSTALAQPTSPVSLIVQLTVLSSERVPSLQDLLMTRGDLYALPFPRRPESVFEGVEMPVAILTSFPRGEGQLATNRVMRFYTQERQRAIDSACYALHNIRRDGHRIPKLGQSLELNLLTKVGTDTSSLGASAQSGACSVLYYQEACRYWAKACCGLPFFRRNGEEMPPPHGRTIAFRSDASSAFAACLLNSSLFYWFYSAFSDCEHINDGLVRSFPVPATWRDTEWESLWQSLSARLAETANRKTIFTKQGHTIEYDEIAALNAKPIIDELDCLLAQHYGFTDAELDFIINYDIKYRMGLESE